MLEYRDINLQSNNNACSDLTHHIWILSQEEGWVVCKVFKKRVTAARKASDVESSHWFDEKLPFLPDLDSPNQDYYSPDDPFNQFLQVQSSKLPSYSNILGNSIVIPHLQSQLQMIPVCTSSSNIDRSAVQVTDWRILDKFVASQLSNEENISKEPRDSNLADQNV